MSEKKKLDHWGLLASELGAISAAEEAASSENEAEESVTESTPEAAAPVAESMPEVVEPEKEEIVERAEIAPPRAEEPKTPFASRRPRRASSSWDALASDFGLAAPEEPAPRVEAKAPAFEPTPKAESTPVEKSSVVEKTQPIEDPFAFFGMRREEFSARREPLAKSLFAEETAPEAPPAVDLSDLHTDAQGKFLQELEEIVPLEERGIESEEEEEPAEKKRRRRRRRRKSKDEVAEEAEAVADADAEPKKQVAEDDFGAKPAAEKKPFDPNDDAAFAKSIEEAARIINSSLGSLDDLIPDPVDEPTKVESAEVDFEEETVDEAFAADEEAPSPADEGRSRRRRSRRRRKKPAGNEVETAEKSPRESESRGGPAAKQPRRGRVEDDEDVDDSVEDSFASDDDDEEGDDRGVRMTFRGIPTWDEAVGMIVTKNMESRAKRPSGSQQGGHGNYGHGNHGGSRGRRGDRR